MRALVLAGDRGGVDPVVIGEGVPSKALVDVGGQTMLARVVAALKGAGIDEIYVSASCDAVVRHARDFGAAPLPAATGPSGSARDALAHMGAPMLVTTADHALLRPEWIEGFLRDVPPDADIAMLLARRETIERDVPLTKRTYLRFSDGAWSGCNLFLLATPAADAALALWQSVERDRKRPWRIVRRLGPVPLLRYVLGRLTLLEAVSAIGARARVRAAIVEAHHGLAAVDVDKPADLALVRSISGGNASAS